MTGMDMVVELRCAGAKPSGVFVDLVDEARSDPYALSDTGIVNVNIGRTDRLADIDFRPLVGLRVHVYDFIGDRARHRRAAALIAAVEPELLVMTVVDGDNLVVHRRFAGDPARTETLHL